MDVSKPAKYYTCPNCKRKLTKEDLRTELSFRFKADGIFLEYIRIYCVYCGEKLKEVVKDGEEAKG